MRLLLTTPAQRATPPAQDQPPGAGEAEFVICDQAIELYHKILKSGCRAEEARLRTAERLVNLIALFCILSWRLFWLAMINRAAPAASPRLALTKGEIRLLDRMAGRPGKRSPPATLSDYLVQIARLGGYLARASDPPPGPTVIWRGWSRLMDIKLGAAIAKAICG